MTLIVDEVMLREPNLLVPGKKPVGNVKIDWSNPLADKLVSFVMCESGLDLVSSVLGTRNGTITPSIIGTNRASTFASNGDKWSFAHTDRTDLTDAMTMICDVEIATGTTSGRYVSKASNDATAVPYRMSFFPSPYNGMYFVRAGVGGKYGAWAPDSKIIAAGESGIIGVSTDGTTWTEPSFYGSGVYTGGTRYFSGADNPVTSASQPLEIGQWESISGSIKIGFVALWSRRFDKADFDAFYADPYQVLIPA